MSSWKMGRDELHRKEAVITLLRASNNIVKGYLLEIKIDYFQIVFNLFLIKNKLFSFLKDTLLQHD